MYYSVNISHYLQSTQVVAQQQLLYMDFAHQLIEVNKVFLFLVLLRNRDSNGFE